MGLPCLLPQSCYWPEPADHCSFAVWRDGRPTHTGPGARLSLQKSRPTSARTWLVARRQHAGKPHSTTRTPPLPKHLPKQPEGFATWVMQCLQFFFGARHPLGYFFRDSFKPCVRAETPGSPGELWPVPPPVRWRWSEGSTKLYGSSLGLL